MTSIPVSVIIVTKNEETMMPRCIRALQAFDEIIVVDSNSTDKTAEISRALGARVIPFSWNGAYPKKRQWCLETIPLKNDYVFFVDADEEVTPELAEEIKKLDFSKAGYFVKGLNVMNSNVLRHGLYNNKLALFDRKKIHFPVINDLDIPGMGEIEGHYQPVLKEGLNTEEIGFLKSALYHHAFENQKGWEERHKRYATWEVEMIRRNAYPQDPDPLRNQMKAIFRRIPFRPAIMFLYAFIIKGGFLDGIEGYSTAKMKYNYYNSIKKLTKIT